MALSFEHLSRASSRCGKAVEHQHSDLLTPRVLEVSPLVARHVGAVCRESIKVRGRRNLVADVLRASKSNEFETQRLWVVLWTKLLPGAGPLCVASQMPETQKLLQLQEMKLQVPTLAWNTAGQEGCWQRRFRKVAPAFLMC